MLHPDIRAVSNSKCTAQAQLEDPDRAESERRFGFKADQQGDNKVPYANTYSFGVAQALPGHTVAEVSYVGSMSRNQFLNGANGHIHDANPIAYGAFFTPDPKNGRREHRANYTSVSGHWSILSRL